MLWDSSLKGFGLRLSQGGSKTFIVMIGPGRRQTIGRFPIVSLSDARTEAKRILAEKQLGKVRPTSFAFDDAKAQFLTDCARDNRPKTVADYTWLFKFFPFGRKSVGDITPRDILQQLKKLDDTPTQKRYAYAVLRSFFKWCVKQHIIDRSPFENLAAPRPTASRERVLNDDELRTIYRTALKGQTPFHKIVCLLVLTGQRRGEIAQLQWSWIKDDGTIELPASVTKNKRVHIFPYGDRTRCIFATSHRIGTTGFVFPAARDRKAGQSATVFNGWSKPKAAFDKECGISDWTLHDIRRTVATNLQRLGVRLEVTEALLNHISGSRSGIVGIYQRHKYLDEMRQAVTLWESHLEALCAKP